MMLKTTCLKCGVSVPEYNRDDDRIDVSLCKDCLVMWHKFHHKYGSAIDREYTHGANGHHASWAVFLGELPNLWDKSIDRPKKERVLFT